MSQSANTVVYDFRTLCTPHYPALVNYANRLLPGRPQEARDLVQEAFLRAFKRWGNWKPRPNEDLSNAARGWLHRIVQNVFLDESRAHILHRGMLDDNHESIVTNTYGVEADHNVQVVSDGVGDEVRYALDSLEPDQREVVELADFHGEQYLAIADILGIPLGTVMSRLHRGRKRLAALLESYAKTEYGIAGRENGKLGPSPRGRKPRIALGTQSDCTGAAALADVSTESVESETDCIDSIVAGDDGCDLFE